MHFHFPSPLPQSTPLSPRCLLLAALLLLASCSQARKIARTAEQANQYKKQAATELARFNQLSASESWPEAFDNATDPQDQGINVRISTSKGEIQARLAFRLAPLATASFLFLAQLPGAKSVTDNPDLRFYIGSYFARPANDAESYIQGGGQAALAPFPSEFSEWLPFRHEGVLAFLPGDNASNGNDGKFIITFSPLPQLFGQFAAFGRVKKGMKVVRNLDAKDQINNIEAWAEGSDGEKFLQQLRKQGMAMLQKLRAEALYQRQGAAAVHQRLARDFSAIQWPRYQRQKLRQPQPASDSYLQQMRDYGLEYKILDSGEKASAPLAEHDFHQVQIQYAAWATQNDGRSLLLHDSIQGQKSIWAQMEQLFPAWQAALLDMRPGEKRLYLMPPEGAYGIHGNPPDIPPWSYLIMELYLLDTR